LHNVIFNEFIPGHLSPVCPAVVNSKPLPSIHPVHSRVCTPAGQAFADVIHACDVALASCRSQCTAISAAPDPGGDKLLSLLTILNFVSLVTVDSFPTIPIFPLDSSSFPTFTSLNFIPISFLSTTPDHYLCAPTCFSTVDLLKPPESYYKACSQPDALVWREAMACEMDSLHSRQAFKPADLPPGHKAIGVWWVFAFKYNPDGSVIHGKEKTRLVAQGFSQHPKDFNETYAPIAKIMSICIIFAFAVSNDLEIMAFDVKTAFLYCQLQLELFWKQIPGYPLPDPFKVLHLLVALYGLHQSTYEFYMLLLRCFTALSMHRCEVDHVVFYGSWSIPPHSFIPLLPGGVPLIAIIPVHVDNGLIVCNSLPLYSWILSELQKSLEIVDMGPASLYLGIHITHERSRWKLWLSQKSYCINLLCAWNLSNCTVATTPIILKPYLVNPSPTSLPDVANDNVKPLFQRLVGSLIYLTICTCPDISYAAMSLGQFNANPT
jgi:Reverse transcriptase (RNA-dependent DNA polymerase)